MGNDFPDAAPRSLYRTADGRWLGLSATSQATFESLVRAMGLPQLIQDSRFEDNAARLQNVESHNQELQDWLGRRPLTEVMEQLIPAGGVVGPVYDATQIMEDPHYQARDDILEIDDPELGRTRILGIVPKFSRTPGSVEHAGPTLGEHNSQIYGSWLGLSEQDLDELGAQEVI